jgi:adenylylsulfate kinase-like enzyme
MAHRPRAVLLITGIQAAGKSTVAQLVAEQLPMSVHLRGDLFRRMVVGGRADMTPDPTPEAVRQLRLRYRLTAEVADRYFDAGFTVVAQDIVLGSHLNEMAEAIRSRPLLVVVLAPQPDAVLAREDGRAKNAYREYAVADLDGALRRETPRIGLWLDSTHQTPAQTAAEILSRAWTSARV